MRGVVILSAALFLAACGSSGHRVVPGKEIGAVRDFVVVNELQEVDQIRNFDQIKYLYVNDYFVVFPTKFDPYLIEFQGRCDELRKRYWTSDMIDIRVSARSLHADYDTLRGCKISKIYELSEPQLNELRSLGDPPGT